MNMLFFRFLQLPAVSYYMVEICRKASLVCMQLKSANLTCVLQKCIVSISLSHLSFEAYTALLGNCNKLFRAMLKDAVRALFSSSPL